MIKSLILISLCCSIAWGKVLPSVAESSGGGVHGSVPVRSCGGNGLPVAQRIEGCDLNCTLIPGTRYPIDLDFITGWTASSASLLVRICPTEDNCIVVLDSVMTGSSISPGVMYTASYVIIGSDIYNGMTVELRSTVYNTDDETQEVCFTTDVDIAN